MNFKIMEESRTSSLCIVTKRNVPAYLKCGAFFESLGDASEDDFGDDELTVPSCVLKQDDKVNSCADLYDLLISLRFWGVDVIPETLVAFVMSHSDRTSCDQVLDIFKPDIVYLGKLQQLRDTSVEKQLRKALLGGRVEIVKYLYKLGRTCKNACGYAAQGGNLVCLAYVHGRTSKNIDEVGIDTKAAKGGNVACLKFALKNCPSKDPYVCDPAVKYGNMACLNYLYGIGSFWDKGTCAFAAKHGQLECLKFLHKSGCPWDENTVISAIEAKSYECLKYAHEHECPWTTTSFYHAAYTGKIRFAQYLLESDCPWDEKACEGAVYGGNLDVLRFLHQQGCPWTHTTCTAAVECGRADFLKYAHERGCDLTWQTLDRAHALNNVEVVEYLRSYE